MSLQTPPSTDRAQPTVTIVVPARDEQEHLGACLDALAAQDYPADRLEIVVVDGGSSDGTRAIASARAAGDARFRLLANPRGLVSVALNLGFAAASGEVLMRVDAHTIPERDYVRRSVEALASTGAANVGGPMSPHGETPAGEAIACAMATRFGVGTARFRFAREVEEVDTVYLGCYPRAVLERVGPFNEELVRNQDYEMNWRIRRGGGKVMVDPRIRSVYLTRRTLREAAGQYASYGYWKARMLRLHPGSLRLRQLAAPALLVILIAAGLASALGAAGVAGWGAARWALPAVTAIYAAAVLAVATTFAARRGWRLLPWLIGVFPTLHLSWGAGFLLGCVAWARGRR